MAEVHLDHLGDISWFKGYGPAEVVGPCPHNDCPHNALSDIAWGPDYEHYALVTCDVPDGCDGYCRAWSAEYPRTAEYADKPTMKLGKLLQTTWSERVLNRDRSGAGVRVRGVSS